MSGSGQVRDSSGGPPLSLREQLDALPKEPGCYRFRGAQGEVIYVGKARSLRSRVRSYFQPGAQHPPKVAAMVAEARSVDVIVTGSELEALILENNLIKEHRPRYNVLLRDDKNFPYLKLTVGDRFPRVVLVRRPRADGHAYFGPFLPASHAWRTLRMIPRFFQVANCRVRFDGKQRPCLYYHLDQCLAPCAGKADPAEYAERVAQVRLFLEGRDRELSERLRRSMEAASRELRFEAAARYRDMLASLERLAERQQMASVGLEAADFWAEYREGDQAAVELFRMREGRVVGRREFTLSNAPEPERLYDEILPQFYSAEEPPPEVVLPRLPGEPELIRTFLGQRRGGPVRLRAPTRGERRRLLDLVARNAKLAFEARFRARHVFGVQVLEEIRDLLGLPEPPYRIEGIDVSHLAGSEPRASVVVFEGGRPRKSDYRSYRIRSAAGGDDYAAVREVVTRRYGRLAREGKRLPDLVLIDGGRGQLAAAREALAALDLGDLPIASIAKREEEIFVDSGGQPLLLGRDDPALHLIQQVRDEAHRFALRQHRRARSRRTLDSPLLKVPGVGPVTARRLLEQFGSVEGIRRAGFEALARAVGRAKARAIVESLAGGS
ncbi:MAG: excinuclease ABC subunit UvrC [Acidobacteria bacterium]|nr:MAG: excinuclease ABC subunit UvrC [Acidobacteriota bacterium]